LQEKLRTPETFSERTSRLAEVLELPLRELGPKIGLATSTLYNARSGIGKISRKTWAKIEKAEREAGLALAEPHVGESPAAYRESGIQPGSGPARAPADSRVQLQPHYAPNPPPVSRAQIEAFLSRYLDAAEAVPGGLAAAWYEIRNHLSTEKLERLAD
jgi:hypothetical protein